MKIGRLLDLLQGFDSETEVKVAGWLETTSRTNGFSYETKSLGSENITAERSLIDNSVVVVLGIDLL